MKKILPLLLVLLPACSTTRALPDNRQILAEHPAPVKIFSIGHYKPNSLILTLVDADERYFTIEAPLDTNLKMGAVYR